GEFNEAQTSQQRDHNRKAHEGAIENSQGRESLVRRLQHSVSHRWAAAPLSPFQGFLYIFRLSNPEVYATRLFSVVPSRLGVGGNLRQKSSYCWQNIDLNSRTLYASFLTMQRHLVGIPERAIHACKQERRVVTSTA